MKLLAQSQGSDKDPKYSEQMVELLGEKVPFPEYFRKRGINTLEKDLINSCHGNTMLTLYLAKEIQKLADDDHRIVAVEQGGLCFAKPSIEAANMPTVPVISIPLNAGYFGGLDAFLSSQLPTGTAVIGSVGVGNYQAAANAAAAILVNEFEGVYTFNASDKLKAKLDSLGVLILGEMKKKPITNYLVVGCFDVDDINYSNKLLSFDSAAGVGVFTIKNNEDPCAAISLMKSCDILSNSVYVRGEENLAFFAAKIVSAYNKKAFYRLKKAMFEKIESYEQRNITIGSFVGGR